MATSIYDQHAAAFRNVSAYVILKNNERVATIAFKHPKDGAGRLYAYVHWLGTEMVRGHAGGYGYDKRTAACASAINKMQHDGNEPQSLFVRALAQDSGKHWDDQLRDAGFVVLQAV